MLCGKQNEGMKVKRVKNAHNSLSHKTKMHPIRPSPDHEVELKRRIKVHENAHKMSNPYFTFKLKKRLSKCGTYVKNAGRMTLGIEVGLQ